MLIRMATETVKMIDNDSMQRLHSLPAQQGKLYKGQSISATTASIPSKYQTIVIDNSDKKGFLSNSKRFSYEMWADDKPGPGSYIGISAENRTSACYSKRGTGMFASKSSRMPVKAPSAGPAPNSYSVPVILSSRTDFNRSHTSSTFHSPIATKRPQSTGPAPNQYDMLKVKIGQANNVHADAAFKSKTKRELINIADAQYRPSPGQYNIAGVQDGVRVPLSSFKSRSSRQFPPPPSTNPGPAQYSPYESGEPLPRTLFPRHNYLCLAAPAISLPPQPPLPGPGSYNLHRSFEGTKEPGTGSSSFISTTGRWSGSAGKWTYPGPAHYNPIRFDKQSFLYNASSRWL